MLWAGAPVLGVLGAALRPGLLQVLGANTARMVLVVVGAVGAARAGGAAAVAHIPHVRRRGGGELTQAGLAVNGAAAARAAGTFLLSDIYTCFFLLPSPYAHLRKYSRKC